MIPLLMLTHVAAFICGWMFMPWIVENLLKRKSKL